MEENLNFFTLSNEDYEEIIKNKPETFKIKPTIKKQQQKADNHVSCRIQTSDPHVREGHDRVTTQNRKLRTAPVGKSHDIMQ
jgi:hypothetical protein